MAIKIEILKVSDLRPYERNARKHPTKQIDLLKNSLQEFGFTSPVLIDSEKSVIAGHARLEAAKALGWEKVPTIRLTDLTEEQVKAYRLADNRIAEMGGWDFDLLEAEMDWLKEADFNLDLIGLGSLGSEELGMDEKEETEVEQEFLVIAECDDEQQQQQIAEMITGAGVQCRII